MQAGDIFATAWRGRSPKKTLIVDQSLSSSDKTDF
jgi:hypothetical protein